jgi:hypothetical protein
LQKFWFGFGVYSGSLWFGSGLQCCQQYRRYGLGPFLAVAVAYVGLDNGLATFSCGLCLVWTIMLLAVTVVCCLAYSAASCSCGLCLDFSAANSSCGLCLDYSAASCSCGLCLDFSAAGCSYGLCLNYSTASYSCGLSGLLTV